MTFRIEFAIRTLQERAGVRLSNPGHNTRWRLILIRPDIDGSSEDISCFSG